MSDTADPRIEAVARALTEADGRSWDWLYDESKANYRLIAASLLAAADSVDTARLALTEIDQLHRSSIGANNAWELAQRCDTCGENESWPCPTARAIQTAKIHIRDNPAEATTEETNS
jgi:hypothetical protein